MLPLPPSRWDARWPAQHCQVVNTSQAYNELGRDDAIMIGRWAEQEMPFWEQPLKRTTVSSFQKMHEIAIQRSALWNTHRDSLLLSLANKTEKRFYHILIRLWQGCGCFCVCVFWRAGSKCSVTGTTRILSSCGGGTGILQHVQLKFHACMRWGENLSS